MIYILEVKKVYILDPLYYLYKPVKRADLIFISKQISEKHNVSQAKIILDMIQCAVRYGAMWTEYGDLNFYERSSENRKTFITTFYNFKLYKKLNKKDFRNVFHEKITFLDTFATFVHRSWIKTEELSDSEIKDFLKSHNNIVAKASYGDSGKEVEVLNLSDETDLEKTIEYLKENKFNLVEEQIVNCDEIRGLNPSSLNTLRIVTVRTSRKVEVLFAGIRVGGKNSKIDNISQGGRVARIDIESGKIDSLFYTKASSHGLYCSDEEDFNMIGFQIPMWSDIIKTVNMAATVVPEIQIVAWDVAITPTGIELVEGNESFGSVIMQLYYDRLEAGLKPRLTEMIHGKETCK